MFDVTLKENKNV